MATERQKTAHHAYDDEKGEFRLSVVLVFPRRENEKWDGGDTILDQLGELSDYAKDTVRVFMASTWSGARRVNIANALTSLGQKGARVEVITMSDIDQGVITQLNLLSGAGGYVKIMDVTKEVDHSKVMLIKVIWDGTMQRIVLMGSENYGEGALKYNNNFLPRLKNSALFSATGIIMVKSELPCRPGRPNKMPLAMWL